MTGLVLLFDLLVAVCIGEADVIFTREFWINLGKEIEHFFETLDGYVVFAIVQTIVSVIFTVIISVLFAFCCITIASIIAKKAKVITAIIIYYVANSTVIFGLVMYNLFAMDTLVDWLDSVPIYLENPTAVLMSLCKILFSGIFCAVLYSFQYWMLDKKLNLS